MTDVSTTQKAPRANGASSLGTKLLTIDVQDGVAFLTYDVPGEPVNTLRAETSSEFEKVLAAVEADPAVKAAVIVSGKPGTFITGADVSMLRGVKTAGEAEALSRDAQKAFDRLARLTKPVVAAVDGACLGGGFELALACHGRVASDNDKTVFGLPEVQLGLLPGADGLQRVAAIVGLAEALDIGLTGKNVRAQKARRLGLVDEVVALPALRRAASDLALALAAGKAPARKKPTGVKALQRLALEKNPLGRALVFKKAREATNKKTRGHYPHTAAIIDVLASYADKGMAASREVEAKAFGEAVVGATAARLVEVFFATTALKKDTGVDDASVTARPVGKVGVLGAGLMGAGIAYVTANAGVRVRLKDRDDASLDRGLAYVADIYNQRAKRGQLTKIERDKKMSFVSAAVDYTGFGNAEVVIEAVFEDLALKHRVLAEVEAATGPETIFASNTSSLPIGRIAAAAKRPANVVGMHYFSPVHKMPLLEVIRTDETAPWVVATAVALGKKQGKTVIVVNDGVGFYTSRVLGPYMNEAAFLLSEGVPVDEIDRALVDWGWPVGAMALIDEVGIDVASHVGPIMVEAFGARLTPPPAVSRLVHDGRKGRKNERGIYLYGKSAEAARKRKNPFAPKRGGKVVDESVYGLLGVTPRPGAVAAEEIQMRCALQFINEALHCYGEGILRSPRDGDIGAIFGLGFPPFRGGPFRYVDSVGAGEVVRRMKSYEDRFGARFTPAPALVEAAAAGRRFYP